MHPDWDTDRDQNLREILLTKSRCKVMSVAEGREMAMRLGDDRGVVRIKLGETGNYLLLIIPLMPLIRAT